MSEYPGTSGDTRVQIVTNGNNRLFSFDRTAAVAFDAGQSFDWTTKDPVILRNVACFTPQPEPAQYFRVALDVQTPEMAAAARVLDLFHDSTSDPAFMWRSQVMDLQFPPDTIFTMTWWSFGLATSEQFALLNFEYLPRQYDRTEKPPCPWLASQLGMC